MENNYNRFRRAAIGGFNRQDVIEYIEKMKNEFFDYKKEVEQTVSQLNEKISQLEQLCETKEADFVQEIAPDEENGTESGNDAVNDINAATFKLRMVADELCKSLSDFMQRVSENAVSVVIERETDEEKTEEYIEETEEEICEESGEDVCDEEAEPEEAENDVTETAEDKVLSILKATDSFCFVGEDIEAVTADKEEEPVSEKRNILDILATASFLS